MASFSATTAFSLVFLSSLLLCIFFFSVSVDARRDDAQGALNDVRALIHFKKCITSDPLSLLKDWDWDDDDHASTVVAHPPNACNWTGISCSAKHPGRVVKISLENAMLRGSLSPHLSNLSFLQVLDIYNNTFSGTIPSSLGTLHRLKVLNLCINEFEGGIPYQLGNLSSLQVLSLSSNSLSGEIPQSLSKLQDLKELNVFQNLLSGQVPSWLGELNKLEGLVLGENNIQGVIPAELGNLSSSLTVLGLEFNNLTGFIPCSLASLYRLTELNLEMNNLTGAIPPCFSNLTALAVLGLSGNNLQGDLPTWIGSSFNNLRSLGLFSNGFTGNIPESWRNLSHLQYLELLNNRLSGTPPWWLGQLCTRLTWLSMGNNDFTSGVRTPRQSIPILNALSNCSSLTHLIINDNRLTGTLPPTFGSSLPNLQYLVLFGNFISGNIPPSLGNLSSLVGLSLHENRFSGTIPSEIANLKSLQIISLRRNQLQGSIPTEVSLLNKSLGYLYLSQNMLSGSVPVNIGKLVNLRNLHLEGNLLSGKIPSEVGNCLVLEDLVLSENNLSGPIPPEVAGIKTIVFNFDLSANALKGEVPPEIGGLQMAQFINLSRNQLSGKIASYMDSWLDVRQIDLSLNNFSGNLSKSIGSKLTQLQRIDLSGNNFTGPVPASLLNHSALYFLNFSYNSFDAEVPCLHSSKKLRLTRWSFLENTKLCGRCFGLELCPESAEQHSSHFNKNNILKIVLGILGGLLLLVVAGILFIFKGVKTSKGETPRISEKFLKISAQELQRATDNFSASNLVGEGSHGKVYRGVLSSGKVVAIKCFSSANRSGADKSFKKECHALGKVRHRNILKIITVVWLEELKALVMPFMSNGSLHSLLHHRENGHFTSLKLPLRVKILAELAWGLCYLHHDYDFKVIHCDIKPENILLDDDMTVKLSDFGISHLIGGDLDCPTASSSFAVKGSVGYIAPEYGIGERISVKGDVYSFGVVTLEVITRLKPTHEMFSGDLTLPLWISMALEGKSKEDRKEIIKNIVKTVDEVGGGIEMDKDEEISVVESILMLGLRCTCGNASMRPNMQEVVSFLQSIDPVNAQDQRITPRNLEEVINVVESQPPLYPYRKRAEAKSSTFSSSD